MITYEKSACNSTEMNTSKIMRLKIVQNEHLQENREGGRVDCAARKFAGNLDSGAVRET